MISNYMFENLTPSKQREKNIGKKLTFFKIHNRTKTILFNVMCR